MDPHQAAGHLGRHIRFGLAIAQTRLPEPVVLRRQIGHDQDPAGLVLSQQLGHGLGHHRAGPAHPAGFVEIALDRRLPVGGDPELGQRPLDADRTARQLDPPDVRGDPSGQCRESRGITGFCQTQPDQRGNHLSRTLICDYAGLSHRALLSFWDGRLLGGRRRSRTG
jgi:hypothetical protein